MLALSEQLIKGLGTRRSAELGRICSIIISNFLTSSGCLSFSFFLSFLYLRKGLTVQFWLALSLAMQIRVAWNSQMSSWLCLLSARIKSTGLTFKSFLCDYAEASRMAMDEGTTTLTRRDHQVQVLAVGKKKPQTDKGSVQGFTQAWGQDSGL